MARGSEWRTTLGTLLRVLCDSALLWTAPAPAPGGATCILRLDAVGDFVLWLDACRRLAAHYRAGGSRVVLVANPAWAGWARELALADDVWELDPARFALEYGYRARWLRRVRAAGFAAIVDPTQSRRLLLGDSLVRASGAAVRIGAQAEGSRRPTWLARRADRWFTQLIPCSAGQRMELRRNADFMRGLGFADFRARIADLAAGAAANPSRQPPKSYAVLAPGAGADWRRWPAAAFAETGRRLAGRGIGLVVAGGPADRMPADAVLRELGPGAEDLVGRTTLAGLAALIAGARLVVANETAAAHIAAAVGTPAVCATGGGHYGRFLPYETEDASRAGPAAVAHRMDCFGCDWNCIYPRAAGEPVKCIGEITPDPVWRAVEAALDAGNNRLQA